MGIAVNDNDIDKVLIDPWSGIHAGSGLILSLLNISDKNCIFLAILWEVIENSSLGSKLWKCIGWNNYMGDSIINIISDICFVVYFSRLGREEEKKKVILMLICCIIYFNVYTVLIKDEINFL